MKLRYDNISFSWRKCFKVSRSWYNLIHWFCTESWHYFTERQTAADWLLVVTMKLCNNVSQASDYSVPQYFAAALAIMTYIIVFPHSVSYITSIGKENLQKKYFGTELLSFSVKYWCFLCVSILLIQCLVCKAVNNVVSLSSDSSLPGRLYPLPWWSTIGNVIFILLLAVGNILRLGEDR